MRNKRFLLLDRIVFWLITLMTVMPSFLSAYTAIDVLAAEVGTVQTALTMDDGTASATGTVNGSGTAVDWVVTVTKFDSEDERAPKLELEYSSGLGTPYNISTNVQQINRTDIGAVTVLRGYTYSAAAETLTMTFTTDITDPVSETVSIKMLAGTVSEAESGTAEIFSSGYTKTLSLANPIAQAAAEAAALAAAEAATQAAAEAAAQATAEAAAQAAAQATSESAPVVQESEVVEEAQSVPVVEPPAVQETPEPVMDEIVPESETPALKEEAIAEEPWIKSDLDDYPPGGLVTLTGAGWTEDVKINIIVDDISTDPQSWRLEEIIAVNEDGTLEFSFNLPDWFVANYKVTATGVTTRTVATTEFTDSKRSYKLTYSAYDSDYYSFKMPSDYPSLPIGRASNPMVGTDSTHTVTSLMPDNLALGQIVPFQVKIDVSGSVMPENGTINLTLVWDTLTTNSQNFGYDPAYKVLAAFVDYGDPYYVDSGINATVSGFTNSPLSGTQIKETITVTGLEDQDKIVVEIWVVLKKSIAIGTGSNFQTALDNAKTVAASPETISTGNQTIPLLQVGDFFSADADVSIIKTDSPDPIYPGETLTYNITVTNNSPVIVANGIVITDTLDSNVTFVSASDGGTHNGGLISWLPFALEPLATKTFTVATTVNLNAPTAYDGTLPDNRGSYLTDTTLPLTPAPDLLNVVRIASMITTDTNSDNDKWQEPTNVIPLKAVTAYKVWSGGPKSDHVPVIMALYRHVGEATPELVVTSVPPTITPTTGSADMFTYTWTGLETYSPTLEPYIYTVDEVNELGESISIPNYVKSFSRDPLTGYMTITNTYQSPNVDVNATKRWVNGPADKPAVFIQLYRKTGTTGTEEKVGEPQLIQDLANTGTYDVPVAFGQHSATDGEGIPYIYYVDEVEEVDGQWISTTIPNYTKEISADGLMITNTLVVGTLTITKVNGLDPTTVLAGARFELQHADGTVVQDIDGNNLSGTTDSDGEINWINIPYGVYKLVETEAPDGFNLLDEDMDVVIDADNIEVSLTIQNVPVQELPNTGGMGTTIFTLIGLGLMLVSGYVYKKKIITSKTRGGKTMSKKLRVFLTTLLSVLVLFGVALPSAALAATVRPTTGTLSIHKLQYNTELAPVIENDGLVLTSLPTGTSVLPGITFKVYKVADDEPATTIPAGITPVSLVTNEFGIAEFAGLAAGRYLVVEDITVPGTPSGIESFTPNFLVDVPMMNPDNETWNTNVHVYPKNQLVLGKVELTKSFTGDTEAPYPLATFALYKGDAADGTADDTLIGSYQTNATTGKINIENLTVGDYYFIETIAPAGYGLNKTPVLFSITINDHDVINYVTDDNFLYPTIDKFVTTIDNKTDTANINALNTWIIQTTIPGDIDDYESYVISDDLESFLDYEGPLTVKAGADTLAFGTDYTFSAPAVGTAGPVLTISIDPDALVGFEGQKITIEFKTSINDTAVMDDLIENNATITATLDTTQYVEDVTILPEVHTGGKKFVKVGKTTDSDALSGAEFKIFKAGTTQYLQPNWTWGDKASARVFTSESDGKFEVTGLAYGNYTLEETKAPTGYNLRADVDFTITFGSYADVSIATITNAPTLMLPSTGGMGTIVFTVIGSVLMMGAVKLYKKDSVEE